MTKKKKNRSLFSILPSDMSSGGLVERDGVSNFALQVRGDNIDNVVRGKGRHCPTDPARGKYFPHILYMSHVTKCSKKKTCDFYR